MEDPELHSPSMTLAGSLVNVCLKVLLMMIYYTAPISSLAVLVPVGIISRVRIVQACHLKIGTTPSS